MQQIRLPEINRIQMTGRLTDKPELSFCSNGTAKTMVRLASNHRLRSQGNPDQKQETVFITVVVWSKLAEVSAEYLEKGSAIYLEGKLYSRLWEKPEGNRMVYEIHVNHIQFLDRKAE